MQSTELKNQPFTCMEDGKVRWFSPSIATVCAVCCKNEEGKLLILFELRGPGCPDYVGKYCMPCGYYDFQDHYIRQGAVREVYEETGLEFDPSNLFFCGIDDGPNTNLGNITLRYMVMTDEKVLNQLLPTDSENRGGETGEVTEFRLFDLDYIINHRDQFCFDHDKLSEIIVENFEEIQTEKFYRDNIS